MNPSMIPGLEKVIQYKGLNPYLALLHSKLGLPIHQDDCLWSTLLEFVLVLNNCQCAIGMIFMACKTLEGQETLYLSCYANQIRGFFFSFICLVIDITVSKFRTKSLWEWTTGLTQVLQQ